MENRRFAVDILKKALIIRVQLNSLIKSDGGNGPMKSGNLLFSKVPIPAKHSRDEGKLDFVRFANLQSAFSFSQTTKGEQTDEQENFYVRIGDRGASG